jgi:DNA-binding MarR family transcriptional regulator
MSQRNEPKDYARRGICHVCGCTEERACPDGCSWADATRTLCTACAEKLGEQVKMRSLTLQQTRILELLSSTRKWLNSAEIAVELRLKRRAASFLTGKLDRAGLIRHTTTLSGTVRFRLAEGGRKAMRIGHYYAE